MEFTRDHIKFLVKRMMSDKKASEWCIKLLKEVDEIFDKLQNCINAHIDRTEQIHNKLKSNPQDKDNVIEFQGLTEGIYMGHVGRLINDLNDQIQNHMQLKENLLAEEILFELKEEAIKEFIAHKEHNGR